MRLILEGVDKDDLDKQIVLSERIAPINPVTYFDLGELYRLKGDTPKAVDAFEKGVELSDNGVAVANLCGWLVNYYYENGKKDKALELAKNAAAVYSYKGLQTLAYLYERMGRLKDAEIYYKRASERYDTTGDLGQFYLRNKDKDANFKVEGEKILKKTFPEGIKKMTPDALKTPPKGGAIIASESTYIRKYGIKKGDVIVGIDGNRVESLRQYAFLLEADSQGSSIEVVVWNGKEYRTIKANLPNRKFACELKNYEPGKRFNVPVDPWNN